MLTIVWDCHGVLLDFARPLLELHGIDGAEAENELQLAALTSDWNLGRGDRFWNPLKSLSGRDQIDWWARLPNGLLAEEPLRISIVAEWQLTLKQFVATSPQSPDEIRPHEVAGTTRRIMEQYATPPIIIDQKHWIGHADAILVDDNERHVDYWRISGRPAVLVPSYINSRSHLVGKWAGSDLIAELVEHWIELGSISRMLGEDIKGMYRVLVEKPSER